MFLSTLVPATILITNQKQKHPVKGDWEPRKVEGGRTASRLMTRGGTLNIKLFAGVGRLSNSPKSWISYIYVNSFKMYLIIYCPHLIIDITRNMIQKNNHVLTWQKCTCKISIAQQESNLTVRKKQCGVDTASQFLPRVKEWWMMGTMSEEEEKRKVW